MTAIGPGATNGFIASMQRIGASLYRLGIGMLVLFAAAVAGFIALLTAFVGIIVAATAIVFQNLFGRSKPVATVWKTAEATETNDTFTIDARRSPEGWTVE